MSLLRNAILAAASMALSMGSTAAPSNNFRLPPAPPRKPKPREPKVKKPVSRVQAMSRAEVRAALKKSRKG